MRLIQSKYLIMNMVDRYSHYSVNSEKTIPFHLALDNNMHDDDSNDDDTEITSDEMLDDDESSPSYSERKSIDIKKMDAKRKVEEYLENRRLEKEWADYY